MEVRKIDFSTNGVHLKDNEAIIPAFCMEFWPGFNGTSPGSKIIKPMFYNPSFKSPDWGVGGHYGIPCYIKLQPPGLNRSD